MGTLGEGRVVYYQNGSKMSALRLFRRLICLKIFFVFCAKGHLVFLETFEKVDISNSGTVEFDKGLKIYELLFNAGHIKSKLTPLV